MKKGTKKLQIKESVRTVEGESVRTLKTQIISANMLEVEAGTNGHHGGDAGSGGRTYFRMEDNAGTYIKANIIDNGFETQDGGFEVVLGGDTELDTVIEALKFIAKVLETQRKNNGFINFDDITSLENYFDELDSPYLAPDDLGGYV